MFCSGAVFNRLIALHRAGSTSPRMWYCVQTRPHPVSWGIFLACIAHLIDELINNIAVGMMLQLGAARTRPQADHSQRTRGSARPQARTLQRSSTPERGKWGRGGISIAEDGAENQGWNASKTMYFEKQGSDITTLPSHSRCLDPCKHDSGFTVRGFLNFVPK